MGNFRRFSRKVQQKFKINIKKTICLKKFPNLQQFCTCRIEDQDYKNKGDNKKKVLKKTESSPSFLL